MPTFWLDKPGESYRLGTTDNDPLPGSPLDVLVGKSYPYATTNAAELGALRENFANTVSERAGILRATNLVLNPSFEVNATDAWFTGQFTGSTMTFTQSTSNASAGSYSAKLTGSWDNTDVQHLCYTISQQAGVGTVAPGKTFYFSQTGNVTQLPSGAYLQSFIRWLKADNSGIVDSFVGGTSGTGPYTFAGSAVAPAEAASAQTYSWIARNSNPAKTASTAEFYMDSVLLSDANVGYFDGTIAKTPIGNTTLASSWTGTPHFSTSRLFI